MSKPTKQQLQEEALEKKLGLPAIALTFITIIISIICSFYTFDYATEVVAERWLTGIAIIAVFVNFVAYVYIKLGILRGVFIISGVVCALIAIWAWFMASLTITF